MKQKNIIPTYIIAAQISFLVSTFWVLDYLLSYQWGRGPFNSTQILRIIVTNMEYADAALGSTALFIIFSRYLLSFGILWPILSWLLSILSWIISLFSQRNKRHNIETDLSIQASESQQVTHHTEDRPTL
jgi:hypothetical protein